MRAGCSEDTLLGMGTETRPDNSAEDSLLSAPLQPFLKGSKLIQVQATNGRNYRPSLGQGQGLLEKPTKAGDITQYIQHFTPGEETLI